VLVTDRHHTSHITLILCQVRTLLAELRLALLDGSDDHVTNASSRETVEGATVTLDGNDVEVLSTGVVSAVDDCTGGETKSNAELVTTSTTTAWKESGQGRVRSESCFSRNVYIPHAGPHTLGMVLKVLQNMVKSISLGVILPLLQHFSYALRGLLKMIIYNN